MNTVFSTCVVLATALTPFVIQAQSSNKELVRKFFEEAINHRDLRLLNDLMSEDYVGAFGEKGPAGFQAQITGLLDAFPDIHYTIDELIADGDKVAVRWTWKGTHKAAFTTIPATGRSVTNGGMGIYEFRNGKIVNIHLLTDRLGFLQQLELVPANPAAAAQKDAPRFIDKFLVPAAGIREFHERMGINRRFLKTLPGFIKDEAYEYTDDNGNLVCITIAEWESKEALNKAKDAVQAEYKKEGFNPGEMFQRLKISMDRGIYKKVND